MRRPREEILAEVRAEVAGNEARGARISPRRGDKPRPPRATPAQPQPDPARPLTWRKATPEQVTILTGLMAERRVPANRADRVAQVIEGTDPMPPTLIDWLRALPRE